MIPSNVEEKSVIDNDYYIVVNEEHYVDAAAHFIAKCIMSNPKAKYSLCLLIVLVQEVSALRKVGQIMDIWHSGKMFYTFFIWEHAFGGLYKARGGLKIAAN
ncbi:uncharacterized protein LOC112082989 [Eutrema salsugineum]|uniref:uncharacterized protein LOC112082989 n=1 Tax=Eutrema salsugineum TaxID=72664 RepID=UPI000CED76A7|nr:uncharacterized protein LOC112082989 [Eutrema salsugineum]